MQSDHTHAGRNEEVNMKTDNLGLTQRKSKPKQITTRCLFPTCTAQGAVEGLASRWHGPNLRQSGKMFLGYV